MSAGKVQDRGSGYLHFGEYEKAIADLSKAIELDPKNSEAHLKRCEAYAKCQIYRPAPFCMLHCVLQ
jgi:Tfp pilus assembly protein PilF